MSDKLEYFDLRSNDMRMSSRRVHSYAISSEYVAGKRVLDLGCGTGSGSAILANSGAEVTGVDSDDSAILEARKKFGRNGVVFKAASMLDLPFETAAFDIVIVHSLIENDSDQKVLLKEVRRVLKEGGLFLVSAANKPLQDGRGHGEAFSAAQLESGKFQRLLKRHFKHVRLIGMGMALLSVGFALDKGKGSANIAAARIFKRGKSKRAAMAISNSELHFAQPEGIFAICSDQAIEPPAFESSLYYSESDDTLLGYHKPTVAVEPPSVAADRLAITPEHALQNELTAQFLGQALGAPVAAEPAAMFGAMLRLNEEISKLRLSAEQGGLSYMQNIAEQTLPSRGEEGVIPSPSLADESHGVIKNTAQTVLHDTAPLQQSEQDMQTELSRQNFIKLHRRINAAIGAAPSALHGRLSPKPVLAKKTWKQRLGIDKRPFKTVIFDHLWITGQQPELRNITLRQYISEKHCHALDPHPLFSVDYYFKNNPDVAQSELSALEHYVKHGWREGRNPHPLFANDWYLEQNPDLLEAAEINPLDHYLQHGWCEGRWPNPVFDPRVYLDRYPDVDECGMEPLTHFASYGQAEGRDAEFRPMDWEWRRFLPEASSGASMMEYLLTAEPHSHVAASKDISALRNADGDWPPAPLENFWPPQSLRDFIIDGYGEVAYSLYWYLYSVMAVFQDRQDEFAASAICTQLIEVARQRAVQKPEHADKVPQASIIIPVYNNILDTLLCIVSVLEYASTYSFEIIVADDGSSDTTPQVIAAIGGKVRYLRQPKNKGFLGNCNAAARAANGDIIVLLNNDTLVMPGWLDSLLSPFSNMEKVGLVGSKLVNWDGSLQEAGGIFWKDGSAWNFGRGSDARAPEFSYLKDVDYCSGASIAIPKPIWIELGGFDPIYTPAYCEDSDLAFRLRDRGYRTLYNPMSEVIHHEGRSHGRDTSSGIKAYQVVNQQKMVKRWRDVLGQNHFPNAENVLCARDRSANKRHILFIDHYVPQWDQDAGSRTIYQYMQIFIELGFAVSFWPDNLWRDPKYTPRLQEMGVEVIYGPRFVNGFENFILERGDIYDAVFISRPHVAEKYIAAIRSHSAAKVLFYGQDLHFLRMEASRLLGQPVKSDAIAEMRALEMDICSRCDVNFYPDPEEVRFLANEIGGNREFIANPVFVYDDRQIAEGRSGLPQVSNNRSNHMVFVGGFNHTPNRDGIIWFVEQVLPLIQQKISDVSLDIVGSKPPVDVLDLERTGVQVLGFVSDEKLAQLYADVALVVAPLRFGAGVKGKVIEAMACGVPVATTSVGAQGIARPEQTLFIGDSAEEYAEAVILALQDRDQATKRAAAALDFISESYSKSALMAVFNRLVPQRAGRMQPNEVG